MRQRRWYGEGAGAVGEPAGLDELRAALTPRTTRRWWPTSSSSDRVDCPGGHRRRTPVCWSSAPPTPCGTVSTRSPPTSTMAAAHRDDAAGRPAAGGRCAPGSGPVGDQLVAPLADLPRRPAARAHPLRRPGRDAVVAAARAGRTAADHPAVRDPLARAARSQATGRRRVGLVAGPSVARGPRRRSPAPRPRPGPTRGCCAATTRPQPRSRRWPRRSTSSTSPATAGTPARTRCSPRSSWPTVPGSATTSTCCPRRPSTVVLSACELGRVSVRSGEEAIGMSAAWLHAGARTVLSSPVLIADDVACETFAPGTRWSRPARRRPTRSPRCRRGSTTSCRC